MKIIKTPAPLAQPLASPRANPKSNFLSVNGMIWLTLTGSAPA